MTKKELSRAAQFYIKEGKTKQETFDLLKPDSELPDEKLATIIQAIPSLQARQKYKVVHTILVILLFITVIIKLFMVIPYIVLRGYIWLPTLILFPALNVYLLWEVAIFRPNSFRNVMLFMFLTFLQLVRSLIGRPVDSYAMIDIGIIIVLTGFSFYLNSKLCPEYKVEKESYQNSEGEHRLRNVIRFED